jgi:hypothetical protein
MIWQIRRWQLRKQWVGKSVYGHGKIGDVYKKPEGWFFVMENGTVLYMWSAIRINRTHDM